MKKKVYDTFHVSVSARLCKFLREHTKHGRLRLM